MTHKSKTKWPLGTVTDPSNIPSKLKERSQWIIWCGAISERKPSKLDKIPYNARSLIRASPLKPKNWFSFEDALSLLSSKRAELSEKSKSEGCSEFYGLGYVLSDDDGFTCIDLDEVRDSSGGVDERYKSIVAEMDSYTEWSPSKKGLHIWVKAKLPVPGRNGEIEMYCSKRYITVTGDDYHGA